MKTSTLFSKLDALKNYDYGTQQDGEIEIYDYNFNSVQASIYVNKQGFLKIYFEYPELEDEDLELISILTEYVKTPLKDRA